MPGSVVLTSIGREMVLLAVTDPNMRVKYKHALFGTGATEGTTAVPTVTNLVAPQVRITGFLSSRNAVLGDTVTWVATVPGTAKQYIPGSTNPPANDGTDGPALTNRINLTEVGIIADLEVYNPTTKTWSIAQYNSKTYSNVLVIYDILEVAVPWTPGNDTSYQLVQTVDSRITPTNMVLTDDATAIGVAFRNIIQETFGAYVPVPEQLYLKGEDIQLYPGRLYHIIGSYPNQDPQYPNRTVTKLVLPPADGQLVYAKDPADAGSNFTGVTPGEATYFLTPNESRRLLIIDPLGYLSPTSALQLHSNDGILLNGDVQGQTDMLVNTPYKAMDITLCSVKTTPDITADVEAQQNSYYMVNFSELHTAPDIASGVDEHNLDTMAHFGAALVPDQVEVITGGNGTVNGNPVNKFTLKIGSDTLFHPLGKTGANTTDIYLTLPAIDLNTDYAFTKITALSGTFPTSRTNTGDPSKLKVTIDSGDPSARIRFYNGSNELTQLPELQSYIIPAYTLGAIKFVYDYTKLVWYAFPEWRNDAAPIVQVNWKYFKGDRVNLFGRTYVCTMLGMPAGTASVVIQDFKNTTGTIVQDLVYANIFGTDPNASPANITLAGPPAGKHFLNAFTLIG